MKNKLLSGAFWMMLGSILSRILGIVYLIPWLIMMGNPQNQNAAQAIFNTAYTPYALFLSLGTAGFPTAIARQVAEYNGQNNFKNSVRVFKFASLFMLFTGIMCGGLLYVFAPLIAQKSAVVSTDVATAAIRVMVPTLVILPPMSLMRGFFQGNADMRPFGISQLWEQFARVIFILVSTFVIMYVQGGDYVKAVNYSTFATFIGAIASYLYLFCYASKKIPQYRKLYQESEPVDNLQIVTIFKNIVKEALPFIFVGSAVTIFQFIDQLTFKDIMVDLTGMPTVKAQNLYTYFSANPNKITTVVISLTIAISETSLPLLASLAKKDDRRQIGTTIAQNIELMLLALIPSAGLLSILAWEVNGVFFPFDKEAAGLMGFALISCMALAIFTDFFTVIQSLGKHEYAVKKLALGIILKFVLQVPLTYLFGPYGTILATTFAFGIISLMVYAHIKHNYLEGIRLRNIKKILAINALVLGVAFISNAVIKMAYVPQGKLSAFVYAALFGGIFMLLYLLLLNKSGVMKAVFGVNVKIPVSQKEKGKHFKA